MKGLENYAINAAHKIKTEPRNRAFIKGAQKFIGKKLTVEHWRKESGTGLHVEWSPTISKFALVVECNGINRYIFSLSSIKIL